jgi:hypothetical protein
MSREVVVDRSPTPALCCVDIAWTTAYNRCLLIGGRSGMRNSHRIDFEKRFGPIRREGEHMPSDFFVLSATSALNIS